MHNMTSSSSQKVLELCTKLTTVRESIEFDATVTELRAAIRAHLSGMRDQVANYALNIAAQEDSKAADRDSHSTSEHRC